MVGLFGSAVLEAAAGLASVYLILALFCTAANEWIAHALDSRARTLRHALASLFGDQTLRDGTTFLEAFHHHALIRTSDLTAYLAPRTFTTVIIDLATAHVIHAATFNDLDHGINMLPPGPLNQTLFALIRNAANLTQAENNIETWFNQAMDRASGWYRRRAQLRNLLLAALITIATNADTLNLLHRFWNEPALRAAPPNTLVALAPIIGWTSAALHATPWAWFSRITGWLLTTLAVSLGAPFWFDILNRAVNLRNAARKPDPDATTRLQ